MKRPCLLLCLAVCLLTSWHARLGAQDREAVNRGKAASVLVDNRTAKGVGTGFCVHPSGLFVTNNHVVEGLSIGDKLQLVQNSSLDDQRTFDARLVRVDEKNDLAILEATVPGQYPVLKLDAGGELHETMTAMAFGFPFGKGLSLVKDEYPTISVNVGKVTSIRRDKKGTQLIQLDAALNPGNSGGPVLNDKGEVIGIVSFGLQTTGINFAIPASKAIDLLKEPLVTARIPRLTPEQRQPLKAQVILKSLGEPLAEPTVEVWVKKDGSPAQKFNLAGVGGQRFEGMISVAQAANETKIFSGTINFPKGKIQGEIANASVQFKGKTLELINLQGITLASNDKEASVTFKDGSTKTGELTEIPSVAVNLGGQVLKIDLSKATSLEIEHEDKKITVSHIIIVKSGGKEIYRSQSDSSQSDSSQSNGDTDDDTNEDASDRPAVASRGKPKAADDTDGSVDADASDESMLEFPVAEPPNMEAFSGSKKVPMPGTITDVHLMGSGSILGVMLARDKKIVLVDLNKGGIAKVLPLASSESFVTGNATHLFIADGARGVLERYDLKTFKRQLAIKLPFSGVLQSMTAGYASTGPILVRKSEGTDALSNATFTLLDPIKLKEIKTEQNYTQLGHSFRDMVHVRASANGRVFGMWCTSHSPQGVQTMVLTDNKLNSKYEHNSAGHVVPSVDGMHIFTGAGQTLTTELRQLNTQQRGGAPCVPTSHPRFYVSVPAEPGAQHNLGDSPFRGVRPGIHEVGNQAALVDTPDLQLGTTSDNGSWTTNDFTLDKRVYYLLNSNLLISVPFSNDHVLLQEFDMKKELTEADLDHFFITSSPERGFTPGVPYRYQIVVQTNRPKIKYELTSAPEGMSVSEKGLITWRVPKNFSEEAVDVIVSVSDGDANQTFDNFTLVRRTTKKN